MRRDFAQLAVLWGSIMLAAVVLAWVVRQLVNRSRHLTTGPGGARRHRSDRPDPRLAKDPESTVTLLPSHDSPSLRVGRHAPEPRRSPASTEIGAPREEHHLRRPRRFDSPLEASSDAPQALTISIGSTSDPEISLVVADTGDGFVVAELVRVPAGPLIPDRLQHTFHGIYSTATQAILKAEAVRQSRLRSDDPRQRWIYIRDTTCRRLLWVAEHGRRQLRVIDLREEREDRASIGEIGSADRSAHQGDEPGVQSGSAR